MKRIFLAFLVAGCFVTVGFAQSADFSGTYLEDSQLEKAEPSVFMYQDEAQRKKVTMEEIPSAVQKAFRDGAYAEWEVLAIYEMIPESGTEPAIYEFELAEKNAETEASDLEGVETEKVSNRQPALVLQIDENGEVLEERNPDEME